MVNTIDFEELPKERKKSATPIGSFRLYADQEPVLDEIARAEGLTRTDVIAHSVDLFIRSYQKRRSAKH